jgi:hypothetical protein
MSPTQRSLAHLRRLGYQARVVERWNPFARVRQDLFGGRTRAESGAVGAGDPGHHRRAHADRREKIQTAAAAGHFMIVKIHITRDELDRTPDTKRRHALLDIYNNLPGEEVATETNALDHSQMDGFKLDDGAQTGTRRTDVETSGRGRAKDAVVGITAAGQADILVTNDRSLRGRMEASTAACEVWKPEKFVSFVRGLSKNDVRRAAP